MNIEIKFRGKTKIGQWVYGTPVFYQNGDVCIYNNKCDHYGCEATNIAEMRTNIIPETLGEYCGLKDKNGKEIYEGDILELKYPLSTRDEEDFDDYKLINVAIIFQSGGFWFTGEGFTDCNWHFYNSEDRKIIGKVFENPELLK